MKSPGNIKEKATRFSIYSPLVQKGGWVLNQATPLKVYSNRETPPSYMHGKIRG